MAVGALLTLPWIFPLDAGAVVPNSYLTFSLTGTSTATDTYSDSALTIANSNPVQADAEGVFGPIYLDPTITYRVKWTTSAAVLIRQQDDIVAGQTVSPTYRLKGTVPELIIQETDASANNGRWRLRVNGEQMVISVGNDAESSWVDAITIDRTANTVDTINLKATAVQANAVAMATTTSGSFTPTWTGFSVAPTGTVNWYKYGSFVYLYFNSSNTGTSNTTAMAITNIPSAIQPTTTTDPIGMPCWIYDNTAVAAGGVSFSSSGATMNFMKGSAPPSATGFTNSGSKGMKLGMIVMYSL